MTGNEGGSSETSSVLDVSDDQQQSVEDIGNAGDVQSSRVANSPVKPYNRHQRKEQQSDKVEDIGDVGDVQSSPAAKLPVKLYDPGKFHDMVRSVTNYSFIGIFVLTVIASLYVVIWRGSDWTNEKDLLQLLLPAETALLGSAVGFYFGSQANKSDGK